MRAGKREHNVNRSSRDQSHRSVPCADERQRGRSQSAQTFRRGRAIAFLERLHVKRSALLQQLEQPGLESIRDVIAGELKATDAILQEYCQAFDLVEAEGWDKASLSELEEK